MRVLRQRCRFIKLIFPENLQGLQIDINALITLLFVFCIVVVINGKGANAADVWMNFDQLPVTSQDEIPGSGGGWLYTTATQNPDSSFGMTVYDRAGWRDSVSYPDNPDVFDFFVLYPNYYYSDHMGWPSYGYLEIDDQNVIKGNSLKYRITGGVNSLTCPCGQDELCNYSETLVCVENGLPCVEGETMPCSSNGLHVTTKQHYLDYLADDQNPIEGGVKIGSPNIYFMNSGPNPSSSGLEAVPFKETVGNNRLSLYVYLPEEKGNYIDHVVDARENPADTFNIGPFNDVGGHWYHVYNLQGGGWIHVIVDGHPQHNNAFSSASLYPYPSSSVRDMGYEYFSTMYRWYIVVVNPQGQTAEAPYAFWMDEIEFYNDTEPQNNETINSPAVGYYPDRGEFEIGFMDKYANNQYSYSTYEVRYSFEQITNANWHQATPVHIQEDDRISYGISESSDGRFGKFNPYLRGVWAPFKLANGEDEARLLPGTTIYFGIKDISQVDGDSKVPSDGHNIYGNPATGAGGRDYQNHGEMFDYDGDKPVLNLIKRLDYIIPQTLAVTEEGDVNGDGSVDLYDVILALQIASGLSPENITIRGDANNDSLIGLYEALSAARKAAGLVEQ